MNCKVKRLLWCFYCRSWVISHWRWWSLCWRVHSCCCIRVTWWRLMPTVSNSCLAVPSMLSNEYLPCWSRCARAGISLWLAGHDHQLLVVSSRSWLSVSRPSLQLYVFAVSSATLSSSSSSFISPKQPHIIGLQTRILSHICEKMRFHTRICLLGFKKQNLISGPNFPQNSQILEPGLTSLTLLSTRNRLTSGCSKVNYPLSL